MPNTIKSPLSRVMTLCVVLTRKVIRAPLYCMIPPAAGVPDSLTARMASNSLARSVRLLELSGSGRWEFRQ
jgi:hypothetical protein